MYVWAAFVVGLWIGVTWCAYQLGRQRGRLEVAWADTLTLVVEVRNPAVGEWYPVLVLKARDAAALALWGNDIPVIVGTIRVRWEFRTGGNK